MAEYINRQAAIDALHGYFDGMLETDTVCPSDLYHLFETLPAVIMSTRDGEQDG